MKSVQHSCDTLSYYNCTYSEWNDFILTMETPCNSVIQSESYSCQSFMVLEMFAPWSTYLHAKLHIAGQFTKM